MTIAVKFYWHVTLCLFITSSTSSTRMKRGYGPRIHPLTESQIKETVDKHNQLRGTLSSSNVRYMTWDSELAKIAEDYGTKCQFFHNTEGTHSKFKSSIGENIYVSMSPAETFDASYAIQLWFDEKVDFNYNTLTCKPKKKCGHYTQVAWATTYKIGCSLVMCDSVTGFHDNSHLFICNYSPAGNVYTNKNGKNVMLLPFKKGKACSKCNNPSDTCSKNGLCANLERDQPSATLNPNFPPINTGNTARNGGNNENSQNANDGLIAAVVILSLLLFAALVYICLRERGIICTSTPSNEATSKHTRFSNQNTPVPSRLTTPRQSFAGNNNLHGITKPVAPPTRPKSKEIQRMFETSSHSAPSSPYRAGRPLRPPPPPTTVL